jgi:NADH dehydrogenase (ubiquinone) 1 alpha subcomplex subunit 10
MFSATTSSLGRALGRGANNLARSALLQNGAAVCAVEPTSGTGVQQQQKRGLVHKHARKHVVKPPPWPYKEKGYNTAYMAWDWTLKRIDDSSKLIVVEGNIGSGKSVLAKELAEQLDFYWMPEFSMDDIMVNMYGIDKRDYYHYLTPCVQLPDIKMFYNNPKNKYNAQMQDMMYFCKHEQYQNAIAHILNTGQGVVLERSPHSDFVFANAMKSKKYLSNDYFRYYHFQRKVTMPELTHWPHLVVYLDTPIDKCLERIKRRNLDYEVNSEVLDHKYLETIQESYKDLLRDYKKHSKILTYDWETAAHADLIIEDIENLDLDWWEWHSGDVLEEWTMGDSPSDEWWKWNHTRQYYTQKKASGIFDLMYDEKHEIEELNPGIEDAQQFEAVMKKFVMGPYKPGYNLARGDGLFWQMLLPRGQRPGVIKDWYDYYWKDVWWEFWDTPKTFLDVTGDEFFDRDFAKHHH